MTQAFARALALTAAIAGLSIAQPVLSKENKAPAKPVAAREAQKGATALKGQAGNVTRVPQSAKPKAPQGEVHGLVSQYARRHGVPETLAHRIVMRESRYNPSLIGRGHYGLMQMSLPTARQMGYAGAPEGLLDARTNLAHGMPYLANAWIVSGGSEAKALSLYVRGYYYEAKRKGLLRSLRTARSAPLDTIAKDEVAAAD